MVAAAALYAGLVPAKHPPRRSAGKWWRLAVLAALGEAVELLAARWALPDAGEAGRGPCSRCWDRCWDGLTGVVVGLPVPLLGSLLAAILFAGLGPWRGPCSVKPGKAAHGTKPGASAKGPSGTAVRIAGQGRNRLGHGAANDRGARVVSASPRTTKAACRGRKIHAHCPVLATVLKLPLRAAPAVAAVARSAVSGCAVRQHGDSACAASRFLPTTSPIASSQVGIARCARRDEARRPPNPRLGRSLPLALNHRRQWAIRARHALADRPLRPAPRLNRGGGLRGGLPGDAGDVPAAHAPRAPHRPQATEQPRPESPSRRASGCSRSAPPAGSAVGSDCSAGAAAVVSSVRPSSPRQRFPRPRRRCRRCERCWPGSSSAASLCAVAASAAGSARASAAASNKIGSSHSEISVSHGSDTVGISSEKNAGGTKGGGATAAGAASADLVRAGSTRAGSMRGGGDTGVMPRSPARRSQSAGADFDGLAAARTAGPAWRGRCRGCRFRRWQGRLVGRWFG